MKKLLNRLFCGLVICLEASQTCWGMDVLLEAIEKGTCEDKTDLMRAAALGNFGIASVLVEINEYDPKTVDENNHDTLFYVLEYISKRTIETGNFSEWCKKERTFLRFIKAVHGHSDGFKKDEIINRIDNHRNLSIEWQKKLGDAVKEAISCNFPAGLTGGNEVGRSQKSRKKRVEGKKIIKEVGVNAVNKRGTKRKRGEG